MDLSHSDWYHISGISLRDTTVYYTPRMWKRYVDDILVVTKTLHKKVFLEHLNSLDPHIQFTSETSREHGSIPFLDTLVMPQLENSLITTVYRKPTHTDLYLHWYSHNNLAARYSVINTLTQRAKTVCSNPQLLKEMQVPWLGFELVQHQILQVQQRFQQHQEQ